MTYSVEQDWNIEGFPSYFFGNDGKLYRITTRGEVRRNKRIVIGCTMDYILKSRFLSLSQLRPLPKEHLTDGVSGKWSIPLLFILMTECLNAA